MPERVREVGGRFGYKDQAQTPNTQLATHSYRFAGRMLEYDPEIEKFVGEGAKAGNSFLTREYRKGFEIPDQV